MSSSLASILRSIVRAQKAADDQALRADKLLKLYRSLRKFIARNKRVEAAVIFVAFCEGRRQVKTFLWQIKKLVPAKT